MAFWSGFLKKQLHCGRFQDLHQRKRLKADISEESSMWRSDEVRSGARTTFWRQRYKPFRVYQQWEKKTCSTPGNDLERRMCKLLWRRAARKLTGQSQFGIWGWVGQLPVHDTAWHRHGFPCLLCGGLGSSDPRDTAHPPPHYSALTHALWSAKVSDRPYLGKHSLAHSALFSPDSQSHRLPYPEPPSGHPESPSRHP